MAKAATTKRSPKVEAEAAPKDINADVPVITGTDANRKAEEMQKEAESPADIAFRIAAEAAREEAEKKAKAEEAKAAAEKAKADELARAEAAAKSALEEADAIALDIEAVEGTTWEKWLKVGKALAILTDQIKDKKKQAAMVALYPHLATIPSVTRSDAKWCFINADHDEIEENGEKKPGLKILMATMVNDGTEEGKSRPLLKGGHPSTTRQRWRNLTAKPKAAPEAPAEKTPEEKAQEQADKEGKKALKDDMLLAHVNVWCEQNQVRKGTMVYDAVLEMAKTCNATDGQAYIRRVLVVVGGN